MKKWNTLLLALALLLLPAAGSAQDLPELFTEVYQSIGEGLEQGAVLAIEAMEKELTLEMSLDSERLEEGKTVRLAVTAGNPLAREANVTITLKLPERLAATPDAAWEAVLPAAQMDPQSGELVPSVTTFTREIALLAGGDSEQVTLESEMSMGTRFYRAQVPLALCVPDVSAAAFVDGADENRLQPGDAFTYRVEIENSGAAPKDVEVELIVPEGMTLAEPLPTGFVQSGYAVGGMVRAEAAGEAPSRAELVLPAVIGNDALDADADAQRLLAATLRVDGERVSVPRIEVCGAKISARLLAQKENLQAGEETTLSVVVVNSGLAEADVQLSCMLPQGLTVIHEESQEPEEADEPDEALAVMEEGGDDLPMGGAAVPGEMAAAAPAMSREDGALMFEMHMDAAKETADGVIANTQVLEIPVRAELPQDNLTEQLMGASLAWSVGDEQALLGDAVAMRVYRAEFLGLSKSDWNGVFWASVLLVMTVVCLTAAVRRDRKEEDYCFE